MSRCRAVHFVLFAATLLCVCCVAPGLVAASPPILGTASSLSAETAGKDVLDRETPRRTMQGFLKETTEGDYTVAANYLDLRGVSEARRAQEGPEVAQKLGYVFERLPSLHLDKLPDTPEGDPNAKPPGTFVADTLYAGEQPIPIALTRVRFPDGVDRWLIARSTVDATPAIDAAYGPRPIGVNIPAPLTHSTVLGNEPWQWIGIAIAVLAAYAIARALAAISVRFARYLAKRTPTQADDAIIEAARRPLRILIGALIFRMLVGPLQLTTAVLDVCEHLTYSAFVLGVSWLVLRLLGVITVWFDEHVAREGADLLRGRRVRTQAMMLRRIASVTVAFFAAAFFVMQFETVRNVGVSLLASAGVASVVVGLAAQKSLSAVIGGIQFSVAQPVRMGDQVVIEGEFGEVEEINLTYAVVRLWDKRRLILPITYFLEKPFQNWTRSATDIVGAVFIKADFAIPVDVLRAELGRICKSDPLWDKRVCTLQVTDADATSVTLRALVSSEDASKLWDLRCNVRERLLAFVHSHEDGKYLARARHAVQAST